MAEEDELKDSEVVEKARETGGIGMIVGVLVLVTNIAYIACPLFLLPLAWLSQP